jgi:hypothetical protein
MDAELKERMKRDALYKGTKLCIANAIKKSHKDLGYPITKEEAQDLIAASIFEVLADVCATFGLNLVDQLKTHIETSGAEVLGNFVKSKIEENTDEGIAILIAMLRAAMEHEGKDDNEGGKNDGQGK